MTVSPSTDPEARRHRWEASMTEVLVDVASARSTITYGELATRVFGHGFPARSPLLMRVLGDVCDAEDSRTGVRLAAVVVRADTGMPGEGYFTWRASEGAAGARAELWRADVEQVWDAYGARHGS